MSVKKLRASICRALEYAQSQSEAPAQGADPQSWHFADQMRMRSFFAHLAGGVGDNDPKLAETLKAFMDASPGDKVDLSTPKEPL